MPDTRTCFWFDTEALEAAKHYVAIFPNSAVDEVMEAEGPDGKQVPMYVVFTLDGRQYAAINGGKEYRLSPAASIEVDCRDQEAVDYYWDKLGAGGQEMQCGWLQDRFGLSWQIVPRRLQELLTDSDPARAKRAYEAMLTMVKLDVAALEAAADAA
ncbi:MAG TPA: VOC family protein [Actinomycetaceae bacterium]|nr:VOC family protein [Actinomycetaceae bacterium]